MRALQLTLFGFLGRDVGTLNRLDLSGFRV